MSEKIIEEINDVYFISKRIKSINPNFKLFFNKKNNLYEIHNFKQKPSLVITYQHYPDEGLIEKLYKTNKDNMKNLFNEIELENDKLEKNRELNLFDKSNLYIKSIFNYICANPSKDLTNSQVKNILKKED